MEKLIFPTVADDGKSADTLLKEKGTLGFCHICRKREAVGRHGPIYICGEPECIAEAWRRYSE